MKIHFIVFFMLTLVLSGLACKKEEVKVVDIFEAGNQEFGWATGKKEGFDWEASGYWLFHEGDSTLWGVVFTTHTSEGFLREDYALNEIPFLLGRHPVKGGLLDLGDGYVGGVYGRWADDGDALLGALEIDDSFPNHIEITAIDTLTKTINGTFEIHFKHKSGNYTTNITGGEFEVRPYQ